MLWRYSRHNPRYLRAKRLPLLTRHDVAVAAIAALGSFAATVLGGIVVAVIDHLLY